MNIRKCLINSSISIFGLTLVLICFSKLITTSEFEYIEKIMNKK